MHQSSRAKFLSVILSSALSLTSALVPMAQAAGPAMPDFVQNLTPAARYGFVDSYYVGQSAHPVVLIQDLHANYGVQKNIVGMLKDLQPKVSSNGKSMVVGIEGAQGNLDYSILKTKNPKVTDKAGDILLKHAEILASERFAAMSDKAVRLVGIENIEDYRLHLQLVRNSNNYRQPFARKADYLRTLVQRSEKSAPSKLKKLWRVEEQFEKGKLDLDQLARAIDAPSLASYGAAESALYSKKLEVAGKLKGQDAKLYTNVVKADQDLNMLSRLLRQQMTLEEAQFMNSKISETLVIIQSFLPETNIQEWRELIRSSIEYYTIARMRDSGLATNTIQLAKANPEVTPVVIVGGFHAAGIAEGLRQNGMSYVIIAPIVTSHTDHDESLYVARLMGQHMNSNEITASVNGRSSVHAVTPVPGTATEGGSRPTIEQANEQVAESLGDPNAVETPKPGEGSPDTMPVETIKAFADFSGHEARANFVTAGGTLATTPDDDWQSFHQYLGSKPSTEKVNRLNSQPLFIGRSTKNPEEVAFVLASAVPNVTLRVQHKRSGFLGLQGGLVIVYPEGAKENQKLTPKAEENLLAAHVAAAKAQGYKIADLYKGDGQLYRIHAHTYSGETLPNGDIHLNYSTVVDTNEHLLLIATLGEEMRHVKTGEHDLTVTAQALMNTIVAHGAQEVANALRLAPHLAQIAQDIADTHQEAVDSRGKQISLSDWVGLNADFITHKVHNHLDETHGRPNEVRHTVESTLGIAGEFASRNQGVYTPIHGTSTMMPEVMTPRQRLAYAAEKDFGGAA